MKRTCKIRIYPNKSQREMIDKTLEACNFIYNKYLERNLKHYKECEEQGITEGKFISAYTYSKELTTLKKTDKDFFWLQGVPVAALQNTLGMAEKAYKNFFRNHTDTPKFKSKKKRNLIEINGFLLHLE